MSKKPLHIQIDDIDRQRLEALASKWGLSLAGVVRRLVRESKDAPKENKGVQQVR